MNSVFGKKGKQSLVKASLLLLAFSIFSTQLYAQQLSDQQEPLKSGLSIHVDNDLFVGADLDKDYTGGFALTYSGRRAVHNPLSVDGIRAKLNIFTGFDQLYDPKHTLKLHAFEVGFALFTPSDLSTKAPQPEQHPYASLFFLTNRQQVVAPARLLAFSSEFTIGALGLDFAENVHVGTHAATGSSPPKGWGNQISSGGEITARYSLSVQKLIAQIQLPFKLRSEFKLAVKGDIGFITGTGVGFSARIGRIHSPWWGFNPHQSEYVSRGSPMSKNHSGRNSNDLFFYFGVNMNHRFYNAILQGQWKESAVTYSANEINSESVEIWAGVSHQVSRSWNISGLVRTRSPELKNTQEYTRWGGLTLSRSF